MPSLPNSFKSGVSGGGAGELAPPSPSLSLSLPEELLEDEELVSEVAEPGEEDNELEEVINLPVGEGGDPDDDREPFLYGQDRMQDLVFK